MGRNVKEKTSKRHRGSKVTVTINPKEALELSGSGVIPGFSPVVPPLDGGVRKLGLAAGVVLVVVPVPPAVLEIQMIYAVSHLNNFLELK